MPSYKTAFGSFLKAEDLQGRDVRVVIESVAIEELKNDSGKEKRIVARFVGKDKGLVLNRTNADSLAEIIGTEDYDDWAGAKVILFPDKTTFGGKKVDCIRIKGLVVAPAKPAPVEREPGEDDITAEDVGF